MRLLIINYYFPPVKVTSSVRLLNFYEYSAAHFEERLIISSKHSDRMDYDLSIDPGLLEAVLIQGWSIRELWSRMKGPSSGRGILWTGAGRLLEGFPLNLLCTEGGIPYILGAYRQACGWVEKRGITHLFTSYRPWTDHAVAYLLKRKYPHLYWIADFRDLPIDPVRRNVIWPAVQHLFCRRVAAGADLLTTVSGGLAAYMRRYRRPVFVLPNGAGYYYGGPEKRKENRYFTIAYTGSVYPGLQRPDLLMRALSELIGEGTIDKELISMEVAGKDNTHWHELAGKYGLETIVRDLGFADRYMAHAIQQNANLNLLLSWSSEEVSGILCSKLAEYLQAGRPILALLNGGKDEELKSLVDLIPGSQLICCEGDALARIKGYLRFQYGEWLSGYTTPARPQIPAFFDWELQMERLMRRVRLEGAVGVG